MLRSDKLDCEAICCATDDMDAADPEPVAFVKRKPKSNVRKRTLDETEDGVSAKDAISAAIAASGKRSKAVKGGTAFTTKREDDDDRHQTFKFASSKILQQQGDQGATAVLETETAHDRDARYVCHDFHALSSNAIRRAW